MIFMCPNCQGALNVDGDCGCGYEECRDVGKRAKAVGRELSPEEVRITRWRLGRGDPAELVEQVEYLSQELWLLQKKVKGLLIRGTKYK